MGEANEVRNEAESSSCAKLNLACRWLSHESTCHTTDNQTKTTRCREEALALTAGRASAKTSASGGRWACFGGNQVPYLLARCRILHNNWRLVSSGGPGLTMVCRASMLLACFHQTWQLGVVYSANLDPQAAKRPRICAAAVPISPVPASAWASDAIPKLARLS